MSERLTKRQLESLRWFCAMAGECGKNLRDGNLFEAGLCWALAYQSMRELPLGIAGSRDKAAELLNAIMDARHA